MQASTVELRKLLKAIQEFNVGTSRWGWDRHYRSALIVTDAQTGGALYQEITKLLPEAWDGDRPHPENIDKLIERLSGLRAAQRLHTKTFEEDNVIYGAYWPWENESLVSVRIGIMQLTPKLEATYEQQRLVCGIFSPGELPRLR